MEKTRIPQGFPLSFSCISPSYFQLLPSSWTWCRHRWTLIDSLYSNPEQDRKQGLTGASFRLKSDWLSPSKTFLLVSWKPPTETLAIHRARISKKKRNVSRKYNLKWKKDCWTVAKDSKDLWKQHKMNYDAKRNTKTRNGGKDVSEPSTESSLINPHLIANWDESDEVVVIFRRR